MYIPILLSLAIIIGIICIITSCVRCFNQGVKKIKPTIIIEKNYINNSNGKGDGDLV